MDLLAYGMENRRSPSPVRRALAEAALGVVKRKADVEAEILERRIAQLPPDADGGELLQKIRERIRAEQADQE